MKKWSGLVVFEKEWEKGEKREREVFSSGKMSKERERAYVGKAVERNNKKIERMNILLKYLVK